MPEPTKLIEWFVNATAWLATWSAFSMPTIQLINFLVSAGIGVSILLLRREAFTDERWVRYFGWAYIVWAIQYLPQVPLTWIEQHGAKTKNPALQDLALLAPELEQILHALGSAANNLLILACAMALLGRQKRKQLFPWWAWLTAVVSTLVQFLPTTLFPYPSLFWQLLPDAMFSAGCLVALGWAIYVNFGPSSRQSLAFLNILGGIFYALANLAFPFNVLVAEKIILWLPLRQALDKQLVELSSVPEITILNSLNALAYLIVFVLKTWLFLGALLLMMKSLTALSPKRAQQALQPVREGFTEYLTDQGIVRALGESVAADLAVLALRLPGTQENNVAWWRWLRDSAVKPYDFKKRTIEPMRDPQKSIVAWVLTEGKQRTSQDRTRDPEATGYLEYVPGMKAFVTVPLIYHNSVVGCLNLEWKNPRSFTATAVQRVRQTADLIAPAVHARRQLTALESLSTSLLKLESSERFLREDTLKKLLAVLHNLLAPAVTGLILKLGFQHFMLVFDQFDGAQILPDEISFQEFRKILTNKLKKDDDDAVVYQTRLSTDKDNFGLLMSAVGSAGGSLRQPSLVSDYLHRRTVASLVADTLSDLARQHFNKSLVKLHKALNPPEPLSPTVWFDALSANASEVSLAWVAARLPTSLDGLFMGSAEQQALIESASTLGNQQIDPSAADHLRLLDIPAGQPGSPQRLIELTLANSKAQLWLAVRRREFGKELSSASPWLTFLKRLAEAADAALVRMERERLQAEANRLALEATRLDVAGLLLHELKNEALSFSSNVQGISDAIQLQDAGKVLDRCAALKQAVIEFSKLTSLLQWPRREDARRCVPLIEPIEAAYRLRQGWLATKHVDLEIQVDETLEVEMPLDVILLVTSSLLANAGEAIGFEGKVLITAEVDAEKVHCHVADNGRGLDPKILEKLFSMPVSTKGEDRGVGLLRARSALRRHRGDLVFAGSQPGSTCFTLVLPKPSNV